MQLCGALPKADSVPLSRQAGRRAAAARVVLTDPLRYSGRRSRLWPAATAMRIRLVGSFRQRLRLRLRWLAQQAHVRTQQCTTSAVCRSATVTHWSKAPRVTGAGTAQHGDAVGSSTADDSIARLAADRVRTRAACDEGQRATDNRRRSTRNRQHGTGGARLGSRQIVYAHAGDTPTSPEEPTAPIALIGSRTKHSSGWSQTRICHSGPEYCVAVLGALYAMSAHSAVWLLYATLHVASRLLPTALCEYSQRRTATGHRPQRTVRVAHGTDH